MGQQVSLEGTTEFSLQTPNGVFKGRAFRDAQTGEVLCYRFTGVRYALPNNVRWTLNKPVADDHDYSDHSYMDFPATCPQPEISGALSFMNKEGPTEEDCAFVNIWVPGSVDFTKKDLPVLFNIHGGWLQYGDPCQSPTYDPRLLQSQFDKNFIIVSPGYRLNSLGFLTSKYLAEKEGTNFGFWDQRLALEWTGRFIGLFGGDSSKITISGLSAGSYSVFFQLAYELYHPEAPQLIKQVVHFSNCLIVQPKSIDEAESQYLEYLQKLGISPELSDLEQLEQLRQLDTATLMEAIPSLKMHTFRAVTDDSFVSSTLLKDMYTGDYGAKLAKKKVRIVMGEVDNESVMYSVLNTPKTVEELAVQLENYYPKNSILGILLQYTTPTTAKELQETYGEILGDTQIYAATRTYLYNCLKQSPGLSDVIYRYRVSFNPGFWKAEMQKNGIPGAIHGSDQYTWFLGGFGLVTGDEVELMKKFIAPYVDFVTFKDTIEWGTSSIEEYRYFDEAGGISVEKDAYWEPMVQKGLAIYKAQLGL